MTDDTKDFDRVKAEALIAALGDLGTKAFLHWDRSPYCARIPLVPLPPDGLTDDTPSVFVFTERPEPFGGSETSVGWKWLGELGGLDDSIFPDVYDVHLEFLERSWLGDTEATIAPAVKFAVDLLTHGMAKVMETQAATPPEFEYIIEFIESDNLFRGDEFGMFVSLLCPSCLHLNTIYEIDKAVRWNRLSPEFCVDGKTGGPDLATFASLGDSQFDHEGYLCILCKTELAAPEGFKIEDWS